MATPGLAGAGSQDEQETTIAELDALGDGLGRFNLVGPVDDVAVDHGSARCFMEPVYEREAFQIVLGEEPADLAGRIEAAVPEPDLVAIGEEDKGVDAVLALTPVSVVSRLAFAFECLA